MIMSILFIFYRLGYLILERSETPHLPLFAKVVLKTRHLSPSKVLSRTHLQTRYKNMLLAYALDKLLVDVTIVLQMK